MDVEFRREALDEANTVVAYYAEQDFKVGLRFQRALNAALDQIARLPYRWPPGPLDSRRAVLKNFPYIIVYRIHPDRIVVHAVVHQHQDDAAWQGRLR